MHHALHIEEILIHIFSYCYKLGYRGHPHPRRQRCYANAHLATLARTCRAFKEPALDMIWAELNGLTPLVRCLPKGSWVAANEPDSAGANLVYSFEGHLDETEWDIILGFTRRIRVLSGLRGTFGLAPDCIEELSRPPASVQLIFPNLRTVGLSTPSAVVAPLVRHFAHSNVTSVLLLDATALGTAINIFGEKCPFVAYFSASGWTGNDAPSNLMCHWKHLRSVRCYNVALSVHALSHLSRLDNLRDVSFRMHEAVVDQICAAESSTPTLIFRTLQELHIGSAVLTSIWRLLRHFRLRTIRDLSVALYVRPSAPDLMSFLVALQEVCTHASLKDLLLRVYHHGDESRILSPEESPLYHITFHRLLPLTTFVNIESITLDIPYGMDLSERELLTLASSWPRLNKLEVATHHDWTMKSAITVDGFLQLLERCRSLRVLYFVFDTRGYTEIPEGHPWRGLKMPKHTFIHLLNSPIEEESVEALGVFFCVAPYPDFSLSTHWNNRYFKGSPRSQELCDLYYDRWVRARTLAHDLWEERRDLGRSLEARFSRRC